jgi:hypothetical protein
LEESFLLFRIPRWEIIKQDEHAQEKTGGGVSTSIQQYQKRKTERLRNESFFGQKKGRPFTFTRLTHNINNYMNIINWGFRYEGRTKGKNLARRPLTLQLTVGDFECRVLRLESFVAFQEQDL